MSLDVRPLTGADLDRRLPDVARLRITVFRAYPYLYDGDFDYEHRYLQSYRESRGAILVGAFDGDTMVGAATGTPMEDHADDFATAFAVALVDDDAHQVIPRCQSFWQGEIDVIRNQFTGSP